MDVNSTEEYKNTFKETVTKALKANHETEIEGKMGSMKKLVNLLGEKCEMK